MKHTKGEWTFISFTNPKIRTRHTIKSSNGDTICKMLRDDNDSDEQEIANAKVICSAPLLLQSAILDNCFPITTNSEEIHANEIAKSMGWKMDEPIEFFARRFRNNAIKKATE